MHSTTSPFQGVQQYVADLRCIMAVERGKMNGFNIRKFITSVLVSAVIAFLLTKSGLFKIADSLSVSGALMIAWSFTFLHTLMGQNAARAGDALNSYRRVTADMRYNIREEKGFIPETLLVGIIELAAGILLHI